MKQYHDLVKRVLANGERMENRTGVDTIKDVGEMMKIDLRDGFPILTTKQTFYKSAANETFGFLRGYTSAADFRTLGVKVWDKNANEHGVKPNAWLSNPFREGEDHLGGVYGDQWRNWPGYKILNTKQWLNHELTTKLEIDGWTYIGSFDRIGGDGRAEEYIYYKPIDQIANCINTIIDNPTDRRIIFHAWNVAALDEMALVPCHLLYQFFPNPSTKRMDLVLYVRSNDVALGSPFNLVGAATMLTSMAKVTGYKAGKITYFVGDCHIYVDSIDYLQEQLTKEPYPLPTFRWADHIPGKEVFGPENPNWKADALLWLTKFDARTDFVIENYQFHKLETPVPQMAV
jgi:thymidylate synthase